MVQLSVHKTNAKNLSRSFRPDHAPLISCQSFAGDEFPDRPASVLHRFLLLPALLQAPLSLTLAISRITPLRFIASAKSVGDNLLNGLLDSINNSLV